jgi:cyclophilin family peptidyl-prolyl cis-trans isomerase/HEAT repeat protein
MYRRWSRALVVCWRALAPRAALVAGALTLAAALAATASCRCESPDAELSPAKQRRPISEGERLAWIQREEWRRSTDPGWLRRQLQAPKASVRARAALAIGRSGHQRSLEALLPLLGDAEAKVRRSVSFALRLLVLEDGLGLTRRRRALDALRRRLTLERDEAVRRELLTTLGWTGGAAERPLLERAFHGAQGPAAVSAWGVLAARGHIHRGASAALAPLLKSKDRRLRRLAAWAAAVTPPTRQPSTLLGALRALGRDPDPMIRANATRAVASSPTGHTDWLLARYRDAAMPVQLAAARGLARGSLRAGVKLTAEIKQLWRRVGGNHYRLTGPRVYAVIAGLQALESRASVATLRQLADDMLELADASDAAVRYAPLQALSVDRVHCAAARLYDFGSRRIERSASCGTARAPQLDALWRRRFVVSVIADMPAREAPWKLLLLRRYLRAKQPALRSAAMGELAKLDDPNIGAALARGISDEDLGVLQAAADSVARRASILDATGLSRALLLRLSQLNPVQRPESCCTVARALGQLKVRAALPALQRLRAAPLRGVRRCADRAVLGMAGWVPAPPPPPSRGLPDLQWHHRRERELPQRAMLVTRRGEIAIELYPQSAPAAVAFFARWAQRRRFRNTRFDRVSPAERLFLGGRADGLDPRSFRLPCELTPRAVERGHVGVALPAGRDSGGARLFIALRRLPLLDGRRTLIGKVVSGMSILDALHAGEKVKDLYIPRPARDTGGAGMTKRTEKRGKSR